MIRKTALCFIEYAISKDTSTSNDELRNDLLRIVSGCAGHTESVTSEYKDYFFKHIPDFVYGNPFFIQLAVNVFNDSGALESITEAITDIENKTEIQPFVDIR